MSTKQNPGEFDCLEKIAPDEPYFVLRAKDPLAAPLVREWAERASRTLLHEPQKLQEALACAVGMEAWAGRKEQERRIALENGQGSA